MKLNHVVHWSLSVILTICTLSAEAAEKDAEIRPLIGINTDIEGNSSLKASISLPYIDAIRKAGGVPILLPPMSAEELASVLPRLDGVMMIGGDDYPPEIYKQKQHESVSLMKPQRSEFDMMLAKEMLNSKMPMLGICAGCQALNIAAGGDLIQDIPSSHPESKVKHRVANPLKVGYAKHNADLTAGSKIANALNTEKLDVVTSHHQCVGQAGTNLNVVAKSDDGMVEAIEGAGDRFLVGVQWHPERDFETNRKLFEVFIKHAALQKQLQQQK